MVLVYSSSTTTYTVFTLIQKAAKRKQVFLNTKFRAVSVLSPRLRFSGSLSLEEEAGVTVSRSPNKEAQ